jgi:hypothetical protein
MFNPRFPTFRARIATLAIMFAIGGGAVLLSGHDPYHRGKDAMVIAAILALAAAVPESPGAKKGVPEKYSFQ